MWESATWPTLQKTTYQDQLKKSVCCEKALFFCGPEAGRFFCFGGLLVVCGKGRKVISEFFEEGGLVIVDSRVESRKP